MEIVYRKLVDLKPHPDNPRKAKPGSIPQLAESIKGNPKYFEARPIILSNRTGELIIIDGERRSEAARFLGMERVPTILMENLTYDEELEILIKGNTHTGVWDRSKLDTWNRKKLAEWSLQKEDFKESGGGGKFKDEFAKYNNNNCDFPIVPVCDEDAEMFIIISRSQIDSNWLRERMKMNKMKSYKTDEAFKVNVVSIEDLKKCP